MGSGETPNAEYNGYNSNTKSHQPLKRVQREAKAE